MKRTIIMMHGLPCSGKSYFAEIIERSFRNTLILKTIDFRRVQGTGAVLFDEKNERTKQDKDESYKLLCDSARTAINRGKTPILDATFHKKYRREWVYDLAKELSAQLIVISPVCDEQTALERLKDRNSKKDKDSFLKSLDAFEIMKSQFEIADEVPVKHPESTDELVEWLKNILS